MEVEADFKGYASKANVLCTDGHTIKPNAFAHQDGMKVPLVWKHGDKDPKNVLGYAILRNRPDGMYTEAFFNSSDNAKHTKMAIQHRDLDSLSIWANGLKKEGMSVLRGDIKEVSIVPHGANKGAKIDYISLKHADGFIEEFDDEAIIYSGESIEHADDDPAPTKKEVMAKEDKTVQDVIDEMSEEQKNVLYYLVGLAAEGGDDDEVQQGEDMTRNIFEQDYLSHDEDDDNYLTHDEIRTIFQDAEKYGSLEKSVLMHADEYGITNIDALFPDAKTLDTAPELIARKTAWVTSVMTGVNRLPFSRVKSRSVDITHEEARARGYIKGDMKKEQYFDITHRETYPFTIYVKQKLDRDDWIDVGDFDAIAFMKGVMNILFEEESARAILFGDGRDPSDPNKIKETCIRPIAKDHDFYTPKLYLGEGDSPEDWIDSVIRSRKHYKGGANPTLYVDEDLLTDMLMIKDLNQRRIYMSESELATTLRVGDIVPVDISGQYLDESGNVLRAVLVHLSDYAVGVNKNGQTAFFDDFDMDFNQMKYLKEGRFSGALTKHKRAISIWMSNSASEVTPDAPAYDADTNQVVIPESEFGDYRDQADNIITDHTVLLSKDNPYLRVTFAPFMDAVVAKGAQTVWKFKLDKGVIN